MTLAEYLNKHGMSFTEAGAALGCSSQYISRVCRGKRQASPHMVLRIEEWTHREVRREHMRPDVYPSDDPSRPTEGAGT